MDDIKFFFPGIVLFCLFMFGVRQFALSQDQKACTSFATASHRETKFVRYSFMAWDCLTPQKDGKWISTENLREVQ